MNDFKRLFNNQYSTPQKQNRTAYKSYNQSRGYSSGKRHRNPIFAQTNFNTTGKKNITLDSLFYTKPNYHIQFQQVISDDFCGCQNTLHPCKRISDNYLKNISLNQLKLQYAKAGNIENSVRAQTKQQLFDMLPAYYPEIYNTHLNNLLTNLQANQITKESFLCLAWIQFHCKLEYITFFFFNDLRKILSSKNNFINNLQGYIMQQNVYLNDQIQYYRKMDFQLEQFIIQTYETIGANIIPLSQYGKFLEITRSRGLKALIQLICLFVLKKRSEMYQILKLWSNRQISNLRMYLRQLNWDVFFQQIQIMH